ncbi:MAG: hypothetical protein EHM93_13480 [Bacteroidales bacterium]|nr:MAG: hypothetical protein EHM93_13480 [Bacteroidales bacterium]
MKKYISKPKQMMSRSFLLILAFFTLNLSAQTITDEQKNELLPKVKLLLKDYERYSQFSADGVSLNVEYKKQFVALFELTLKYGVFNDISPSKKGIFPTAEKYLNFVETNYKQGLDVTIDIDNIKIVDVVFLGDSYSISVLVHKKAIGIFNDQGIIRFDDDLYFLFVSGVDEKGKPSSFRISGILTKEKYAQVNAKQKGIILGLGVNANYSKTKINSSTVSSSDLWKPSAGRAFSPGLDIVVMLNKRIGIGTGLRLSSYNSSFNIRNYNQTSDRMVTDIDGDKYNPVLQIPSLSQQSFVKSIDIPLILKFVAGKGKAKYYFDIGLIGSIISKSYFTLSGSSVKAGYYETLNVTLSDIPEYGFGSYSYNKEKKYVFLKKQATSLSGYTSIGILYQLSSNLLFKLGAGLSYGFTDLNVDSDNADNFINITSSSLNEKTSLRSAGIELGVFYLIPFKR